MIVGVVCKEESINYEGKAQVLVRDYSVFAQPVLPNAVDDGTAVLRILQTREKGHKTKSSSTLVFDLGVPDCYIYSRWYKHDRSSIGSAIKTPMLAPLVPAFQVGDIIRCTGKIVSVRQGGCFLRCQHAGKSRNGSHPESKILTVFCAQSSVMT